MYFALHLIKVTGYTLTSAIIYLCCSGLIYDQTLNYNISFLTSGAIGTVGSCCVWVIVILDLRKTTRPPAVQKDVEESDPCAEGKRMLEGRDWRTCKLTTVCGPSMHIAVIRARVATVAFLTVNGLLSPSPWTKTHTGLCSALVINLHFHCTVNMEKKVATEYIKPSKYQLVCSVSMRHFIRFWTVQLHIK